MSCHLYKLCVLDAHKGDASFWTCLQDIQEGMQVSIHQHISFANWVFECIYYKKNSKKWLYSCFNQDLALWDVERWTPWVMLKIEDLLRQGLRYAIVGLVEFILIELVTMSKLYWDAHFVALCTVKLPANFVVILWT